MIFSHQHTALSLPSLPVQMAAVEKAVELKYDATILLQNIIVDFEIP